MGQQKSWAMSAIVIGTYLCAVCFAGGPGSGDAKASPVAARPPRPTARPAVALPAIVTVKDLAGD